VTQAAVDYITRPLIFDGSTEQIQFNAFMGGDLGDYGVRLPTADEGIRVVFGLEYRNEHMEDNPDEAAQSGDMAGSFSSLSATSAGYSVREFFTEASMPLLQGKTAAELLSVDAAYRYSDYSTNKTTNTYKFAGEWMPISTLRFRASFQRAVRVGNINELFRPPSQGGADGDDTCAGQNPISTLEQCQNTGLDAARYGNLPFISWEPFNLVWGGNPDVDPEESDTVSFGVVITPEFLSQITLSLDYFDIEVRGAIGMPYWQFLFDQCIETGQARFCDTIHRDPATGLLSTGAGYVDTRNSNIGTLRTSGIDVVADYAQPIGRFGDLQFSLVGTYVDHVQYQRLPGEVPDECVGIYTDGCGIRPELATNLRSTWIMPWNASISLLWRHTSKLADEDRFTYDLPSTDYFDLAGIWEPTDNLTLRFGINNLFDKDPPLVPDSSANTMPGDYDALGRYIFAGLTFRL
jgi:iron complex outermembrane receptor protein